jgi:mono/diheme cytochrome c family protein
MWSRGFLGLIALASLAAAPRKPREEGPAAQLSKAPASARALENPYAHNTEAIAAGRKLYDQHCAECHGGDARGLDRAANLHAPAVQKASSGALFWALRNGRIRKGMPSWSHLPDQKIWQLVSYIRTLEIDQAAKAPPAVK